MSCCTQALSVGNILVLHNQAIHRIRKMLRIHCRNGIPNHLLACTCFDVYIWNNGKAVVLQKLLLAGFTFRFQIVTDQIKGPELKKPVLCLAGIQLAHTARSVISRMGIRILQTHIDLSEVLP